MKIGRFLIIVSGLILYYGLSILKAGTLDLRSDEIKGQGVSTVNDNFRGLNQNKLDNRPGHVIPREASKYNLGSATYPWSTIYVDSIAVVGSSASHVSGYRSTDLNNFIQGNDNTVNWDAIESDTTGMFSLVTDSATIPLDGVYSVAFTVRSGPLGAAGDNLTASVYKNGVVYKSARSQVGSSAGGIGVTVTFMARLVMGDLIGFNVKQDSGSPKDLLGGIELTYFSITRLGT